ncbi:MAG: carboxypeptidase-like regulatory domain-containing protein, partial [Bacteroidota bacterium]
MHELLIYSLKGACLISLLYLADRFFWQGDTNLSRRRAFLLAGIFASVLLPLIPLSPDSISGLEPSRDFALEWANVLPVLPSARPVSAPFSITNFISLLWQIGAGLMLVRLVIVLVEIMLPFRGSHRQKKNGVTRIYSPRVKAPYVFLHWLFVPVHVEGGSLPEAILVHEKAHIYHRHSVDILLMEALLLLQWFNPFAWGLKRQLRDLHEFQADAAVLAAGQNRRTYQKMLLQHTAGTNIFKLVHPFFQLSIVKRIKMMNRKKSAAAFPWRYALLVPVILMSLTSFAFMPVSTLNSPAGGEKGPMLIEGIVYEQPGEKPIAGATVLIKGTSIGTLTNREGKFRLKIPAETDGTLVLNFINLPTCEVKVAHSGYLKVWMKADGQHSSTHQQASLEDMKQKLVTQQEDALKEEVLKKQPLFIIDGERVRLEDFGGVELDPDKIASMDVLKKEESLKIYGEAGKNGVIIITTKEGASILKP